MVGGVWILDRIPRFFQSWTPEANRISALNNMVCWKTHHLLMFFPLTPPGSRPGSGLQESILQRSWRGGGKPQVTENEPDVNLED
jgi:hypothetical protein